MGGQEGDIFGKVFPGSWRTERGAGRQGRGGRRHLLARERQ